MEKHFHVTIAFSVRKGDGAGNNAEENSSVF